jgi:hypothetical protein
MNIHPQRTGTWPAARVISQQRFEFEESQKHLHAHHPWVRDVPVSLLQENYDRALRRAIHNMEIVK